MFDKFLDLNHPFFLPVWRRYATIAACAAWAMFEWTWGDPFWATLASGLAAYTFYSFTRNFNESIAIARRDKDKNA
jgi:hypothetical protein